MLHKRQDITSFIPFRRGLMRLKTCMRKSISIIIFLQIIVSATAQDCPCVKTQIIGTNSHALFKHNNVVKAMNDTTIIRGSRLLLRTQRCIGKASWSTISSQNELTDLVVSPTTSREYIVKSFLKGCPDAYDTVSVTVLSFNSGAENEISIYPNPSKASIEVRANQSLSSIEVIDNYGRTVSTSELSGDIFHTVSLAKLPSGIYYVKVVTGNRYLHIEKIIKE